VIVAAIVLVQAKSPSMIDTGMSWLKQTWAAAQKQGAPIAEAAVRKYRLEFRQIPVRVRAITSAMARKYASMHLQEKEALLAELWRVRSSLDLMALLDPDLLHQLTGIDARALASMQTSVSRLWVQAHPTVKS